MVSIATTNMAPERRWSVPPLAALSATRPANRAKVPAAMCRPKAPIVTGEIELGSAMRRSSAARKNALLHRNNTVKQLALQQAAIRPRFAAGLTHRPRGGYVYFVYFVGFDRVQRAASTAAGEIQHCKRLGYSAAISGGSSLDGL